MKFHPKLVASLRAHAAAKEGQGGEAAGKGESASAILDDMFGGGALGQIRVGCCAVWSRCLVALRAPELTCACG
eukprot:6655209-Prymnesium_polylepis.1